MSFRMANYLTKRENEFLGKHKIASYNSSIENSVLFCCVCDDGKKFEVVCAFEHYLSLVSPHYTYIAGWEALRQKIKKAFYESRLPLMDRKMRALYK